jgi:hypothetical protein
VIERGKVFSEEAYALGKMLDHSSWQKGERRLPRRITPSDLDIPGVPMVFDAAGALIIGELSRSGATWDNLTKGQRWAYESYIRGTRHCAVVCYHEIRPEEQRYIDTRHDMLAFQIMVDDFGVITSQLFKGNDRWQNFVFAWMEGGATRIRRQLLGFSAGMIFAPSNVVPIKGVAP